MLKKVALVGRPNVGKSTLFNRLVGRKHAITSKLAGTTRDRLYGECDWDGYNFQLIDMGGIELDFEENELARGIQLQINTALAEADLLVFLIDARSELLKGDLQVAELLRKQKKSVILVANKCEDEKHEIVKGEFRRLGLGEAITVSAQNGRNTDDLLDKIVKTLKLRKALKKKEEDVFKLAIVGKPNVGKSSILNAITGKDFALVSSVAGTTRDTIDTDLEYKEQKFKLIDTAGIRRKGKIGIRNIEHYAVLRSLKAIERCQVAALILDAATGIDKQDQHIIEYVLEAKKGLLLVLNKWDLVEKDEYTMPQFKRYLQHKLDYVPWAPLLFTSAITKKRLMQILDMALVIKEERCKRVETGKLNALLEEFKSKHPPSARNHKYRQPKIYYVTQAEVDPPTFVFFVNNSRSLHFSYIRYIENRLRDEFGFIGTPLVIRFRDKKSL